MGNESACTEPTDTWKSWLEADAVFPSVGSSDHDEDVDEERENARLTIILFSVNLRLSARIDLRLCA